MEQVIPALVQVHSPDLVEKYHEKQQRSEKDLRLEKEYLLLHLVVVYWLGNMHLGSVFVQLVVMATEFLRRLETVEVMEREFHPL